jgi:selenocysteine-specific elongation factor
LHCLTTEPINTPHAHDMARTLGIPPPAVEEILRIGIEIGEVVALADGVLYTPEQIDNLRGRISEIADGKPFAMTDMRDALGTTRKYVMPLLEYFDAAGITVRDGDQRTLTA